MFFQKSIISFVAVAALAAGVSASSIVARQAVQCSGSLTPYCCPQPLPFTNLPSGPQSGLPSAAPGLDQSQELCENFSTPPSGQPCPSGTPLCCAGTVSYDNVNYIYNCQAASNADQDSAASQPVGTSNNAGH